jgi:hypothetical protein
LENSLRYYIPQAPVSPAKRSNCADWGLFLLLKSDLSDVAKNRAYGRIDVLNVLLLTHLFTVLSLVTL